MGGPSCPPSWVGTWGETCPSLTPLGWGVGHGTKWLSILGVKWKVHLWFLYPSVKSRVFWCQILHWGSQPQCKNYIYMSKKYFHVKIDKNIFSPKYLKMSKKQQIWENCFQGYETIFICQNNIFMSKSKKIFWCQITSKHLTNTVFRQKFFWVLETYLYVKFIFICQI